MPIEDESHELVARIRRDGSLIARDPRELEGAHANVACGRAYEDPRGFGLGCAAPDPLPRLENRECAARGNAEGIKRLRDEVFAIHRAERRFAVRSRTRKRREPAALEVHIHDRIAAGHLAHEVGAAVAEDGREGAKLVARIRHGVRAVRIRKAAREAFDRLDFRPGINAELSRKRNIHHRHACISGNLGRALAHEIGKLARELGGQWRKLGRHTTTLQGPFRRLLT